MPVIEFKDLTFYYATKRTPALKDINFKIKKGEFILLAGPSGSGKSTILKCINGLIPNRYYGKYSGEVYVKNVKVKGANLATLSQIVGTVMQEVDKQLVLETVEEDVAFGPCNLCLPKKEIEERVTNALESVKALHLKKRSIFELSGGEKQRVVIAGILAMKPEILLFDEPLANLDSEGVKMTQEQLKSLKETGKTIIVAEHRTEEILEVGVDKIVIIERGEILEESTSPSILRKYKKILKIPPQLLVSRSTKIKVEQKQPREHSQQKVAIEFKNVSYTYDEKIQALKNISFKIYEGEKIALLGNNGAGKSTIAKLILGLIKPTKGQVLIYGDDTREKDVYEIAGIVGLVMQNPYSMLFAKTVREELSFGPKNLGVRKEEIDKRVEETAKKCRIDHLLEYSPFASSHGEKRRIGIGSILTMKPKILILDEPTAGQDYASYTSFMNFVQSLSEIKTMILITHETDLAIEYTDRTIVLSNGKIIADGPTRKILLDEEILRRGKIRETSLIKISRELTSNQYVLKLSELLQENYQK